MPAPLCPRQETAPGRASQLCGRETARKKDRPLRVASWNVRTLLDNDQNNDRPRRRTALVAYELNRYNVDIAALSETRFAETGSLTEEGEKYTFFWSGRRQGEPRMHGVGFAVKMKIANSLSEAPHAVSERIMTLRLPLAHGRHATIISAYAPTLVGDDLDKDAFYEDLNAAICSVSPTDELVLLGDFNARVGTNAEAWPGVLGRHGVGKMNDNGLRLLSLCAEHSLVITNTIFQLKNKYKTTWMHPRSKHWHLIDYTIVRQRSRNSVKITRAMRGAECWTDHRMVLSKLTLTVRPPVRRGPSTGRHLNCSLLLKSAEMRATYQAEMERQLAVATLDENNNQDLDAKWKNLSTTVHKSAEATVGYRQKNNRDWFDESRKDISDLLSVKNAAHDACLRAPGSLDKRTRWQTLRGAAQTELRHIEDAWWSERAREIQAFADANDIQSFYAAIKQVHGPTNRSLVPVKASDGTLLRSKQDIMERWAEHFRALLNTERPADENVLQRLPAFPEAEDLSLPPTRMEFDQAVLSLKNGTAPGPDGIPAEAIKYGGAALLNEIFLLVLQVWENEVVPTAWKNSKIITIYKRKGEKSDCENSRGISLLSHAGKILTRILLGRLVTHVSERILPETQCGFRAGRGTVDMMFVARQMQEKCREQNRDLYLAFVDLAKAFDTVNRNLLWQILKRYGCPEKFIAVLRQFYDDTESRVAVGGDESSSFPVTMGVKQGCVIAPVLFNLYVMGVTSVLQQTINDALVPKLRFRYDRSVFDLKKLKARTRCQQSSFMELQYADDCALIAHNADDLQQMLDVVSSAYEKFGLSVSCTKTEILFQPREGNMLPAPHLSVGDNRLKTVEHFKYLGGFLSNNCTLDYELNYRLNQANISYGRLRARVLENHGISLRTKVRVYRAVCMSALLYGSETWVLYRSQIKRLEAFHIRSLQRIMGITWRDRIPHTIILERANISSVEAMLFQRRLRWTGHVWRMGDHRLPKAVLYGELAEGNRKQGGPKKRFKDQLKATLKNCSMDPRQLEIVAAERSEWRSLCHQGVQHFETQRTRRRVEQRERRHEPAGGLPADIADWTCEECGRRCASRIGLHSHRAAHARRREREGAVVIGPDGPP